jgi:two-component system, cell cycle sensor histidine kinase and response regulator CckA
MAVFKASARNRDVTVMLAEDESMIRELIATFLTNLGFTVVEAENGREALDKARQMGPSKIDLLITDLVMPVMGGLELAGELRKLHSNIRILFISGYTDDIVILERGAKVKTAFLRKPFSFDVLRQRVDGLLQDE